VADVASQAITLMTGACKASLWHCARQLGWQGGRVEATARR